MKIQDSGLQGLGGASNAKPVRPAGVQARAEGAALDDGGTDIVKLSSASQLLAIAKALEAPSHQAGVSHQAKLDSIAAQVRSGTYQADLGQVSRAIVQGHLTN
jgi:hypothetical protein